MLLYHVVWIHNRGSIDVLYSLNQRMFWGSFWWCEICFRSRYNTYDLKKKGLKYSLLKQGDAPREHLLNEFLNDISSILLATSSFWQGIDIPGESLSCVLIDRLPFSVPTDPITEARINWIKVRGGNPFQEYQLPSAIILLKQGFGRLIRNQQDRGLLVILDTRIMTKSYGKVIFKNLPDCPVVRSIDDVAHGMRRLSLT